MTRSVLDAANLVVLVGTLSSPPRPRSLPSGSWLVDFDVTTRGGTGTCSVPVAWPDPGARADRLDEGSPVVVVGYVRRRFFRAGGVTASRTEVVAVRVADAARAPSVGRLLAEAVTLIEAGAPVVQRTRKPASNSPSGAGSSTTSTPVTSARGGPSRHHATS